MSLNKRENELFQRWKLHRSHFVPDGIADEDSYRSSNPKLMFILKEVNSNSSDWDLRDFLRSGKKSETWENVARWVIGIRKIGQDFEWKKLQNITQSQRVEALSSICAINLKKSPGGHTTNNDELEKTANEDVDYLNSQFSLYDSDIIVCCGSITNKVFHSIVRLPNTPKWEMTNRGVRFHEYQINKYIISFSHPAARVQDCLIYYGLIDAVREILQNKKMN